MSSTVTENALDQAGFGLRAAIECGDLENARKLLLAYRIELEKSLESISGDNEQTAALAANAKEFFDWARDRVSEARAQTLADLDALNSKRPYLEGGRSGVKSWEIEA